MTNNTITVGKYTFIITENKLIYNDRIISHTFKIGGTYDNCISISYTYRDVVPVSAKILFVKYEPEVVFKNSPCALGETSAECSITNNLEKGGGTALMLKTLLRYVYKKIPSIHIFTFEDMSHIDCSQKDLSKSPPRNPERPISLAYLSIAYNSCTWYEKYFDAAMIDNTMYFNYKNALRFLTDSNSKVDFLSFLQIAKPPEDQISYLETIYTKSSTYRIFFNQIPFDNRCELLRPWLKTFIEYYLTNNYSPYNWKIDVTSSKIRNGTLNGGRRNKIRNVGRSNKTIKRYIDDFYPSKYKIIMFEDLHLV